MSAESKKTMLKMGLVAVLQEITFDARRLELEDLHGHDRRLGDIVHVGGPQSRRRRVGRGVDRGVGGCGVLRLLRIVAAGARFAAEDIVDPPCPNGCAVHPPSRDSRVLDAVGRDAVGAADDDRGGNWHAIVRVAVDPLLLAVDRHADRVTVKPSLPWPPAIL